MTDENLTGRIVTASMARWLIGAARQFTTITYSEAALRLKKECGFSQVPRASQMTVTATALQYAIRACTPSAPLINVLLVRKDTGLPASGVREFLALRYPEEPRIGLAGVDTALPALWDRYARRAIKDAQSYPGWESPYVQLFGPYVPDPFYVAPARVRGGGGEGPSHRALREWVRDHPERIARWLGEVEADTEVDLLSGDRVDVVYQNPRESLVIEVKSKGSNWADLRRGVYQCVKYRAVVQAQEKDRDSDRAVGSLPVTESPLPVDLEQTARRLGVAHIQLKSARR